MRGFRARSIAERFRVGESGRRGFALLEVMISVAMASLGVLGTLLLLMFNQAQNDQEQQRARAHQIVCEELERVRHELFSRITPGTTITVWDNGTPDDSTDDTQGTLEVVITNPATGATLSAAPVPAVIVNVEVTLTWNPAGRRSTKALRETVMTSLVP